MKTSLNSNIEWQPIFFRDDIDEDIESMQMLLQQKPYIKKFDFFYSQLQELIRIENIEEYDASMRSVIWQKNNLKNKNTIVAGVWVYYPWAERLVHILNKNDFIKVRTSRNKYKITDEEAGILSNKKVGIIGLSVGQSIALTIAIERIVGEIRLADFDIIELSNLNRIRTGLHNIGIPKVYVTAREIAEIDPFLNISCFDKGISEENIHEFCLANGRLDLLIDECDSLDIKLLCREYCKQNKIPVLMDTSDRGMLDIERFDLEPSRPILHGLVADLHSSTLKGLTTEQKVPYVLSIIGVNTISERAKASMIEVNQSILTWPQLSSSVALGGAIAADTCRRIFLNELTVSGRFFVDVEEIVKEHTLNNKSVSLPLKPAPLSIEQVRTIINSYAGHMEDNSFQPSKEEIDAIVEAASLAPSGGNCQPWKWIYTKGYLFLLHDISRSFSFLDYNHFGSYVAFGAATENLILKSHSLNLEVETIFSPLEERKELIAVFKFYKEKNEYTEAHDFDSLSNYITSRTTNRKISPRKEIDKHHIITYNKLLFPQDELKFSFTDQLTDIEKISQVVSNAEKQRLLNAWGHNDFVNEIRWTKEENEKYRDGIDLATLDLSDTDKAALQVLKDWQTIDLIKKWDKGNALKKMVSKSVMTSSAVGLITAPYYTAHFLYRAGRLIERIWLQATKDNIAFQPISPLTFMLPRLDGNCNDINEKMKSELYESHTKIIEIFGLNQVVPVFLFRLFIPDDKPIGSLRKTLNEIFIYD